MFKLVVDHDVGQGGRRWRNGGRKVGRKVAERRQKVAEKMTDWVAEMVAEFPHLASDSATG